MGVNRSNQKRTSSMSGSGSSGHVKAGRDRGYYGPLNDRDRAQYKSRHRLHEKKEELKSKMQGPKKDGTALSTGTWKGFVSPDKYYESTIDKASRRKTKVKFKNGVKTSSTKITPTTTTGIADKKAAAKAKAKAKKAKK